MARKREKKKFKLWKFILEAVLMIAIIVGIVLCIHFFCKIDEVEYKGDLGEFSAQEIASYMKKEKIENTVWLWARSLIRHEYKMPMFEEYSVKMLSPHKVQIKAYEKKFKGEIKQSDQYYYFTNGGILMKLSSDRVKKAPRVVGIKVKKPTLYEKVVADNKKNFDEVCKVATAVGEYKFKVKKIVVDKKNELTLVTDKISAYIKNTDNLDRKLVSFNDIYKSIKGKKLKKTVLDMSVVDLDGGYTAKKK